MLLKTSTFVLIALLGVTHSRDSSPPESLVAGAEYDNYRPWNGNDTSSLWISLEGMDIGKINYAVRVNVPGLRWLVMDNNKINAIPSGAFDFSPDLTYISLVANQISQIAADSFRNLEKLRVIDLDWNPIAEYLDSNIFSSLPALEALYLRNCDLPSFDLPGNLSKLSHLYLSSNRLRAFQAESNSALTHLHLDNNALCHVSLSNFRSLVYLNLTGNRLEKIVSHSQDSPVYGVSVTRVNRRVPYYDPDESELSLEYVPELKYLVVSSNEITEIQSDTFFGAESLVSVDLSGNQIKELDADTFTNLIQLEYILLDSNQISKINYRAFASLPNLKVISLKNNQISHVDEDAFTKLDSSANEVYLFLDNNRIHTLRRNSFAGIRSLKHIGLSHNRIKIISSYAFVDLPNLESILIADQFYTDRDGSGRSGYNLEMELPEPDQGIIESYAFTNLKNVTWIEIRGNIINNVEAKAFAELPELKSLDLSDNGIESLSSEAFSGLPKIEDLFLGGNSISKIEPETFPKQLKRLDLAWNRVCRNFSCWNLGELYQLEELDVSGITEALKLQDFAELPNNLTVVMKQAPATSSSPVPCY